MLILVVVGIAAASFSLLASYVIWRARGRSAWSNVLAGAAAVVVASLVLVLLMAVLTRIAFPRGY